MFSSIFSRAGMMSIMKSKKQESEVAPRAYQRMVLAFCFSDLYLLSSLEKTYAYLSEISTTDVLSLGSFVVASSWLLSAFSRPPRKCERLSFSLD